MIGQKFLARISGCFAILLVVSLLSLQAQPPKPTAAPAGKSAAPAGPPPAPVALAPVIRRPLSAGRTYIATVYPAKTSAVGSAVDGRVVNFPIKRGDRVKKGAPLCQLLTDTIDTQIRAAEAELDLRKHERDELKNGSRPEEVAQAEARCASAKAMKEFTNSRYERSLRLMKEGNALSKDQLEEAHSAAVDAEQTLLSAQATCQLVKIGPRIEKIAQADARVAMQAAVTDQLKDQLKKHTIYAPFDGYIVKEGTEVGEWVSRGQVVAEVVALDEVEIEAHVVEAHVEELRIGMSARVEIPAVKQQLFVGEIANILPQADLKSRTFPVRIRVQNSKEFPLIKAGMVARVTLPAGEPREMLLVKKDAIVLDGPNPGVYVFQPAAADQKMAVGATGSVIRKPVELETAEAGWIGIKADLEPGQFVVVLGNERLRPGQPVSVLQLEPPLADQSRASK